MSDSEAQGGLMGHNPAARTHRLQIGENKWEDPNKRLFGVEGTGPNTK